MGQAAQAGDVTDLVEPFHGGWTYPAAPDLFLVKEVNAFQALTRRVAYNAKNFVSALRRRPG